MTKGRFMLNGVINQFLTTVRLMRDPRVPVWAKAIPVLAVLYVISPFDFLPDFALGLGQLDDIGIVLGAMRLFESFAPNDVVREHREEVVEGQARKA